MIEHVNTILHEQCLPVSICKTITHNYKNNTFTVLTITVIVH